MGKFELKKRMVTFDFCGLIFECDLRETTRLIKKNSIAMTEYNKNPDGKTTDDIDIFMAKTIDEILGEGATEEILQCENMDSLDLLDIYEYICETVKETREKHLGMYGNKEKTKEERSRQYKRLTK